MRKAIIAAIVASALFAVGAFAASFSVQSEDVASGSNDVVACADFVDVDFTTVYNEADNGWRVTKAVVTFYNGTADAPVTTAGCEFFDATLVLENEENAELLPRAEVEAVPGGSSVVEFEWATLGDAPLASAIGNAAVLVDGRSLFANNIE